MALTVTPVLDASGAPVRLTVTSDKRITPAVPAVPPVAEVREAFTITVEAAGESTVYSGSRLITPAVPGQPGAPEIWAPVVIIDSRGKAWLQISDNGTTAVFELDANA